MSRNYSEHLKHIIGNIDSVISMMSETQRGQEISHRDTTVVNKLEIHSSQAAMSGEKQQILLQTKQRAKAG